MERITRNVAAFVGVFALGCVLVAAARPLPAYYRAKLAQLSGSDAEVVFLGSSWTGMGIDPALFERQTGHRAFVFVGGDLHGYRMEHVAREVVPALPASARLVVVEANPWLTYSPAADPMSQHALFFWDAQTALGAMKDDPSATPAVVRQFLARLLPLDVIRHVRDHPNLNAYVPLEGHAPKFGRAHYHRSTRAEIPGAERLRRMIEATGRDVIFLAPPHGHPVPVPLDALNFNVPASHPDLFENSVRWDAGHLNAEGARLFTRELACRLPLLRAASHC